MEGRDVENYLQEHQKLVTVLLLIIGMGSVSGMFMGMRQTDSETEIAAIRYDDDDAPPDRVGLPAAPKYGEIPTSDWLANSHWTSNLNRLPQQPDTPAEAPELTPAERDQVLADRATRRAFDGAPPTIPHAIDQLSSASCLICHSTESSLMVGAAIPAEISHPYFANCTQCHVPADGLREITEDAAIRLVVANAFEGRPAPGPGSRAYPGAPPTVPHPQWMRQNCMACHDAGKPHALSTPHPLRSNCLQCHAPNADFDNRERLDNQLPTALLTP